MRNPVHCAMACLRLSFHGILSGMVRDIVWIFWDVCVCVSDAFRHFAGEFCFNVLGDGPVIGCVSPPPSASPALTLTRRGPL